MTHPERVTEAVVRQHDCDVLLLCAYSHHQHTRWADEGLKPRPSWGKKAVPNKYKKTVWVSVWSEPSAVIILLSVSLFLFTCRAASSCPCWVGPAGPDLVTTRQESWKQSLASAALLGLQCQPCWVTGQSTAWHFPGPASVPWPRVLAGQDLHRGVLERTLEAWEGAGVPAVLWRSWTVSPVSPRAPKGSRRMHGVAVGGTPGQQVLAWPWRRWRRWRGSDNWGSWGGGASRP